MKTNRLIFVFLIFTYNCYGQSLDNLVKEGEILFEKTKTLLVFPKTTRLQNQAYFYSELDTLKNVNFLTSELKRLQSQQFTKDIGLVFKANAHYNFRAGFDEETNNFNIGRIKAELEWNILQSGFTNNRAKSKRLENEMKMLQNDQEAAERILKRRQFRIDYTYVINKETIRHFEKFQQFENEYFDFLNKLYLKKYIKRERLIEVGQQINVLKNQINVLNKENEMIKDSISEQYAETESLPLLELKIDSLSHKFDTRNLELQKENVYLQHKAINDLNLSFYVQENFNYSRVGYRLFPSVGIRFRAPIRFNHRKKIIDTKLKILSAQQIDQSVGEHNRIITLIGGYNEKLKDAQNQYKGWKVLEERIRVLSVLKSELRNGKTGTFLLELLEEQFKVLENMLKLKRQLYTSLSHIFELIPNTDIQSMVTPFDFNQFDMRSQFAIQYSATYDLKFQIQFLKAKGCTEVEVLEKDTTIQEALQKANIAFRKVKKIEKPLVALSINKELTQIHLEP